MKKRDEKREKGEGLFFSLWSLCRCASRCIYIYVLCWRKEGSENLAKLGWHYLLLFVKRLVFKDHTRTGVTSRGNPVAIIRLAWCRLYCRMYGCCVWMGMIFESVASFFNSPLLVKYIKLFFGTFLFSIVLYSYFLFLFLPIIIFLSFLPLSNDFL